MPSRRLHLAVLGAILLLAGCRDEPDSPASGTPGRRYTAVRVATFDDRDDAVAFRDSLDSAGWAALVRERGIRGERVWEVQLLPTSHLAYPEVVGFALRHGLGDTSIAVVHDSGPAPPPTVGSFTRVSYTAAGRSSRARWALSPDRRKLLVVEDAAGVENEPAANGFVFASEAPAGSVQLDSIWDVAPAPDWTRVAFGRAYILDAGPDGSLPDSVWGDLAERLGVPAPAARRAAFAAGAMIPRVALAQPGVAAVDSVRGALPGDTTLLAAAGGWRVRWSDDGRHLYAALPGPDPKDDAEPVRWVEVDPGTDRSAPVRDRSPGVAPHWIEGPIIGVSTPSDPRRRVTLDLPGARVESVDGWIRRNGRIIGPGVALAATREGRYIAALVPNPTAKSEEAQEMLVVYGLAEGAR